jgi:dienelactone hydrolase
MDEYAPGRRVIVRGTPEHGVVLLWHGRGVDGAAWMLPLAERVAAHGVLALSADWNSEAVDGGRSDLLTSLRFARDLAGGNGRDPDSVVVAGWSLGGTAAVSLAVHGKRLGVALGRAVLIAPGDGPRVTDPVSGATLPTTMPPGTGRCGIDLVYGDRDTIATPDLVAGLELRLRIAGWRTALHALDGDHGDVVGAAYDERRDRFVPSRTPLAVHDAAAVAAIIAQATSWASSPS